MTLAFLFSIVVAIYLLILMLFYIMFYRYMAQATSKYLKLIKLISLFEPK